MSLGGRTPDSVAGRVTDSERDARIISPPAPTELSEVSLVLALPDGWQPPSECASRLLELVLAVRDRETRAA